MQAVSIIPSRSLYIGRHMCHKHLYVLWIAFICTVLLSLIYFRQSACTISMVFRVSVNFLIRSVRFRKICNQMILQSTSEAHIWFPTITFITFIIRVVWIKGWLLTAFFFQCCLNNFSVRCEPPQWLYLDRKKYLSLSLTKLSKLKVSICKSDIDNDFDQWIFLLSLVLLNGLLSEQSIFHTAGNCLINFASANLQCNLPKP